MLKATYHWTTLMSRIAFVVILAWIAGGPLSVALAQEDDAMERDLVFQQATSSSKDDIQPLSHCGGNHTTATFSGVTTWQLCFDAISQFGLVIRVAEFRRASTAAFVRVLFDGRISEIFVPYHAGSPRFMDVSGFNFPLLNLSTTDCPSPRVIIGSGKVCREIRDRGIAWKNDSLVRRGQELVLWAVIDAANYNYIIEWAFRDDGTIAARAGSTGPKLGGSTDTRGHMHTFSWRLDIDLNGAAGDSVRLTRHLESGDPSTATDSRSLISVEGGRVWTPTFFNELDISDASLRNSNGRRTSYRLTPYRTGTARHSEAFTRNDFWVTAHNSSELFAKDLPSYVDGQTVSNADVVVWYTGSAHHENGMRDEDRDTVSVLWTGFELIPQNLFNRTPLFP